MQRGAEVFDAIGRKIAVARGEADEIARSLREATEAWERSRVAEGEDLARLAKVRLQELEARHVVTGLDAADRQALGILARKQEAVARLDAEGAASEARQAELESERQRRGERLDASRAERAGREAEVLGRLADTEAYAFQKTRADKAADRAAHADAKATRAERDRVEKGRPYEQDRLFRYLWERGYGFPRYKAIPLIRTLDAWVARLVRYDRAHLDYRMLLEIPVRLREHAERLKTAAEAERGALASMEQEALDEAGVTALDAQIEKEAKALAAQGRALEEEEARHAGLREERAAFDAGRDPFTLEAVETLRRHLETEPLSTIRADAARTPTGEDDALAQRLADELALRERLEPEIARLRRDQEAVLSRLEELEEVRRRYRRRRYDARDSVFEGGLDAGDLLDKLVRGGIVVGDVLGQMNRHHRFEFPTRGRADSGWGIPMPGPRPPRPAPSRPAPRHDGFRTDDRF